MTPAKINSFSHSKKIEPINIGFPWLLVLRWGEVICQILLIIVVSLYLEMNLPLTFLCLIILIEAISNIFLHTRLTRGQSVSENTIFMIFAVDTLLLTGLLHLTGGAMNPFTFLYLVHIVIAAIILAARLSWIITLLTLLCYGLLFLPSPVIIDLSGTPVTETSEICHLPEEASGAILLHLKGMWVAFAITSFFIVFFVSKIQKDLAIHNQTLISLKETRLRNERLASLTGLAAGAAHELSTPLGTVAIAVGEMIYQLKNKGGNQNLIEDAMLIRKQVVDCKEILYQMSAGAGELRGEELQHFTIEQAINQIMTELGPAAENRIDIQIQSDRPPLHMGFRTLCRTLKGLLKNGLEASKGDAIVSMKWYEENDKLIISVEDQGSGMSPEVLRHSLEPFYTTKETGMGLGLFLAKTMAQQFGGDVSIKSSCAEGTTVTVSLANDRIC